MVDLALALSELLYPALDFVLRECLLVDQECSQHILVRSLPLQSGFEFLFVPDDVWLLEQLT